VIEELPFVSEESAFVSDELPFVGDSGLGLMFGRVLMVKGFGFALECLGFMI